MLFGMTVLMNVSGLGSCSLCPRSRRITANRPFAPAYWPGGGDEGAFYAYAYPEPDGFADHPVGPESAYYSVENGQFLLPYEAVRTADDPDRALLQFLHTSYEAAAELGGWDRAALEDDPSRWNHLR